MELINYYSNKIMRTIASYSKNIIKENYKIHVSKWDETNPDFPPYTIQEWCELESQSDPGFYRWLFSDDVKDFGSDLTDDELILVTNFFNSL